MRHDEWIKQGKKVFLVKDMIEGEKRPVYSLTHGSDEQDAISGTDLENPKGVVVIDRVIKRFAGSIPSDGFFFWWVKA